MKTKMFKGFIEKLTGITYNNTPAAQESEPITTNTPIAYSNLPAINRLPKRSNSSGAQSRQSLTAKNQTEVPSFRSNSPFNTQPPAQIFHNSQVTRLQETSLTPLTSSTGLPEENDPQKLIKELNKKRSEINKKIYASALKIQEFIAHPSENPVENRNTCQAALKEIRESHHEYLRLVEKIFLPSKIFTPNYLIKLTIVGYKSYH